MSIRFRKNSQIYALCIPLNKKGEAGYRSAKKRALQALRTDAEQLSDIQLIHFNPAFVPSSVEEIIVRSVKALGEDGASSTAITKLEPLLWGVDVYGLAPPPQRSAQLYVGIAEYFITEGKEDLAYIALKNAGRAAAQWAAAQSENSPRIHTLSEKIAHLQAMLARQAHTQ